MREAWVALPGVALAYSVGEVENMVFRGGLLRSFWLVVPLVCVPATDAEAQALAAPASPKHAIALHMDTFDFAAVGFSVWGNFYHGSHRFFIAGGRNELPDFLNPQGAVFHEVRDWFGQAGYAHYLSGNRGFFLGFEAIVQSFTITAKSTGEQQGRLMPRVGPLVGFEWMPFDFGGHGLSIIPWASIRVPVLGQWLPFSTTGESYRVQESNFVMGLNLGYRVSL